GWVGGEMCSELRRSVARRKIDRTGIPSRFALQEKGARLVERRASMQRYAFALGAILLSACSPSRGLPAVVSAGTPAVAPAVHNDIPPRLQWNATFGYCGETSFISAGL